MKKILIAVLLVSAVCVRAVEPAKLPLKACVKWSREIPEAVAAGAGLFDSVARVDAKGPYPACDVVTVTESFGVGWLMSAWMKEDVVSPCGNRLGGFKFRYKGDQWQGKVVTGLHEFLSKHPEALAGAKNCPTLTPLPTPTPAPAVLSTAPAGAP